MYLSPGQFEEQYPRGEYYDRGTYGRVYRKENTVIKVLNEVNGEIPSDGFYEILVYESIRSPCILNLLAWTYSSGFHLALPFGYDIKRAFFNGEITLDQIIGDLLSGVEALAQIHLCHNDIRPCNMVYLDGYVKLIDFGIASYISDGLVYYPLFTEQYRDPEIPEGARMFDSRISLYAIGKSIHEMFGWKPILSDLYAPLKSRLTIPEIFDKYPNLRRTPAEVIPPPEPGEHTFDDDTLKTLAKWVLELVSNYPRIETLTVNLVHRCLDLVSDKSQLQLLACGAIYLAQSVSDEALYNLTELVSVTCNQYTVSEIQKMAIRILIRMKGRIAS